MIDPNTTYVDPSDVFTADEFISDEEGTYFEGKEIAFAEFSPEDDQDVYEADVLDEFNDWGQLRNWYKSPGNLRALALS